jgi:hypothetical protein
MQTGSKHPAAARYLLSASLAPFRTQLLENMTTDQGSTILISTDGSLLANRRTSSVGLGSSKQGYEREGALARIQSHASISAMHVGGSLIA